MKKKKPTEVKPVKKISIKNAGLPPGTIIFTGDRKLEHALYHITTVKGTAVECRYFEAQLPILNPDEYDLLWIDIRGIHDVDSIKLIGQQYGINSLILEDIANVNQIPKFIEIEQGNFVTLQAHNLIPEKNEIEKEQISIFFTSKVVICFQEDASDTFEPIRKRIINTSNILRYHNTDYLVYAIVDLVVDFYLIALRYFDDLVENLEFSIENQDKPTSVKNEIYLLRRNFIAFSKSVYPLREAIMKFKTSDSKLIHEETRVFLDDLYDHTVLVNQQADTITEMIYGLYDLFHSEINYKTNEVIKTLTVVTSIFIPLTFIVGVYGMNFDNMPELHHPQGYLMVWIVMIMVAIGLLIYFRIKKWI